MSPTSPPFLTSIEYTFRTWYYGDPAGYVCSIGGRYLKQVDNFVHLIDGEDRELRYPRFAFSPRDQAYLDYVVPPTPVWTNTAVEMEGDETVNDADSERSSTVAATSDDGRSAFGGSSREVNASGARRQRRSSTPYRAFPVQGAAATRASRATSSFVMSLRDNQYYSDSEDERYDGREDQEENGDEDGDEDEGEDEDEDEDETSEDEVVIRMDTTQKRKRAVSEELSEEESKKVRTNVEEWIVGMGESTHA